MNRRDHYYWLAGWAFIGAVVDYMVATTTGSYPWFDIQALGFEVLTTSPGIVVAVVGWSVPVLLYLRGEEVRRP